MVGSLPLSAVNGAQSDSKVAYRLFQIVVASVGQI